MSYWKEQQLFPLLNLKPDQMIILRLKDGFDDRVTRVAEYEVRERCMGYGYVIRIQKYLDRLYVIRVE